MDWIGIAAVIAAIGVIVNNVLTFLARRELAENTKKTDDTKKATEATGQKITDASEKAKDAAEIGERAVGAAEQVSAGIKQDINNLHRQIGESFAAKFNDHNGRIIKLESNMARMQTDVGEILKIVKEKP